MIVEIDETTCIGCTTCYQICPMDVLRMGRGKARIAIQEDCMACFLCELHCPMKAIYVDSRRSRYIPQTY